MIFTLRCSYSIIRDSLYVCIGFFEKFLFINNPSYADRFLLFKTLIENQVPFHELNLSTLSQFSSGKVQMKVSKYLWSEQFN